MRMLAHAEKAELWNLISFFFLVVCGFLGVNQLFPSEVDALVPTILPCWVLGLFTGLTIFSATNAYRHSRKAKNGTKPCQTIKEIRGNRIFF